MSVLMCHYPSSGTTTVRNTSQDRKAEENSITVHYEFITKLTYVSLVVSIILVTLIKAEKYLVCALYKTRPNH